MLARKWNPGSSFEALLEERSRYREVASMAAQAAAPHVRAQRLDLELEDAEDRAELLLHRRRAAGLVAAFAVALALTASGCPPLAQPEPPIGLDPVARFVGGR